MRRRGALFLFLLSSVGRMIWAAVCGRFVQERATMIDLGGISLFDEEAASSAYFSASRFLLRYSASLLAISTPKPIPKQYANLGPGDGNIPKSIFLVDTNIQHIVTEAPTANNVNTVSLNQRR